MLSLRSGIWRVLLLMLAACGGNGGAPATLVEVAVHDDANAALAGVPLEIDGVVVAATDAHGNARASLEMLGGRVRASVRCPDAYRSPEPRMLALGPRGRRPVTHLDLTCHPKLRSLLVVVRAPQGKGLTLRADGEPVATVGEDGTLHAVLQRNPGADLRLTLDTSSAPKLSPQHPVREIRVEDRDEIVVFDQGFAEVEEPRARTPRPRLGVSARKHMPYAIGGFGG